MIDDTLHRYKCQNCSYVFMSFYDDLIKNPRCSKCESVKGYDNLDFASTVATTVGPYDVQYDNIDTIDEDVATEVERVELDKDLVEMEKGRRGEGVSSEQQ